MYTQKIASKFIIFQIYACCTRQAKSSIIVKDSLGILNPIKYEVLLVKS